MIAWRIEGILSKGLGSSEIDLNVIVVAVSLQGALEAIDKNYNTGKTKVEHKRVLTVLKIENLGYGIYQAD